MVQQKMGVIWELFIISSVALSVAAGPFPSIGGSVLHFKHGDSRTRGRRSPTLSDREKCNPGDVGPVTRVNTSSRLRSLIGLMHSLPSSGKSIDAYIIPMDDEHQSEYVAAQDKRIKFISGFSGSAGRVVVTNQYAALWTDGRYFLQAEAELDCNWIFMKQGEPGTPTVSEWISKVLVPGNVVGSDPAVLSYDSWISYKDDLAKENISLLEVPNLVDDIWTDGSRPDKPKSPILVLNLTFSGESWESKVERVRVEMRSNGVGAVVINFMDESAWLYNLRGEDVSYNPVFISYSIVELNKTSLYMLDVAHRLQDVELQQHLNAVQGDQPCHTTNCVHVYDYDQFYNNLAKVARSTPGKIWISPMSSYRIYSTVVQASSPYKVKLSPSIIRLMKGRKNPTEIQGMRNSQNRDSAALIEFITMLEKSVKNGDKWTEISAADELERIRRQQKYNRGLSFDSISASGSNGAIIHYRPEPLTDLPITTKDMYLIDSGGQYLDGTTDVTRTYHFGTPTDFQKEAYTRVLMGVIGLATAYWPNGTYGRSIDVLAREPLWSVGLEYKHGTGHGIGAFLNIHEGPSKIYIGYRKGNYESPMFGEMFFSDEPGYYEAGEFGIRLETIVMTKKVETEYEFGNADWLGFEIFTLVPFEPNLIKYELLNSHQRKWLNFYNARCLQEIGEDILKPQNKMAEYEWVKARTKFIPDVATFEDYTASGAIPNGYNVTCLVAIIALLVLAVF